MKRKIKSMDNYENILQLVLEKMTVGTQSERLVFLRPELGRFSEGQCWSSSNPNEKSKYHDWYGGGRTWLANSREGIDAKQNKNRGCENYPLGYERDVQRSLTTTGEWFLDSLVNPITTTTKTTQPRLSKGHEAPLWVQFWVAITNMFYSKLKRLTL